MKSIISTGLFFGILFSLSCRKTTQIPPVSGTIDGKPAVTLYGSSLKPTDYMFIDTAAADRKISYDGIVFNYIYNSTTGNNIYIVNSGIPAADGTLSLNGANIILTITTSYTNSFASSLYTSR